MCTFIRTAMVWYVNYVLKVIQTPVAFRSLSLKSIYLAIFNVAHFTRFERRVQKQLLIMNYIAISLVFVGVCCITTTMKEKVPSRFEGLVHITVRLYYTSVIIGKV